MFKSVVRKIRERKGFSLIEVATALALLALGLPAITYLFMISMKEDDFTTKESRAYFLANQFMSEISTKRFYENASSPGNGLDSGEYQTDGSRSNYDDIDDYDNLNQSPPKSSAGTALTNFSEFRVRVTVENVSDRSSTSSRTLSSVSAGASNTKLITIKVLWNNETNNITLAKLVTRNPNNNSSSTSGSSSSSSSGSSSSSSGSSSTGISDGGTCDTGYSRICSSTSTTGGSGLYSSIECVCAISM